MDTAEAKEKDMAEWRLRAACKKTEVFAEFLNEYGEQAGWEEWLNFLQERPELKGFDWARSLAKPTSS